MKTELIELSKLRSSGINPRRQHDQAKHKELVQSIKDHGVITPVLVRPSKDAPGAYEIVCGERRCRAARDNKLKAIPAEIRAMGDAEVAQIKIVENLQREDLGPMDEAAEYERITKNFGMTVSSLSEKVSKPVKYVKSRLRLLSLAHKIKKAIAENKISANHGLVLARIVDQKQQVKLFKTIINRKLSANASENLLKHSGKDLRTAPFKTTECKKCRRAGRNQADLFDKDTDIADTCLDGACWARKAKESGTRKEKPKKKPGIMTYRQVLEELILDKIRNGSTSFDSVENIARTLGIVAKCRVCGCTNDQACPGGCHWIEKDLCSFCKGRKKEPFTPKKKGEAIKTKVKVTSKKKMTEEQKKAADSLSGMFKGKQK